MAFPDDWDFDYEDRELEKLANNDGSNKAIEGADAIKYLIKSGDIK